LVISPSALVFEVAVRGRAARMHDALGNALVVEVRDLLAQDEVFEQRRPAQPPALSEFWLSRDRARPGWS
jgi:hypothetical protein